MPFISKDVLITGIKWNRVAAPLLKTMLKLVRVVPLIKESPVIPSSGKGTKLDNHIQIGHDTVIGRNCLFASQVGVAGCVIIEDDVILWGQVGVQKDLTIGKGAIVLGNQVFQKALQEAKPILVRQCRKPKIKCVNSPCLNNFPG
jgi:acyl-[acyl carrier protein]--UDP-N-acetylglucosamine O-acyltransferase